MDISDVDVFLFESLDSKRDAMISNMALLGVAWKRRIVSIGNLNTQNNVILQFDDSVDIAREVKRYKRVLTTEEHKDKFLVYEGRVNFG